MQASAGVFRMDGPAALISDPIPCPALCSPLFIPLTVSLISIVLVRQKQHLIMENAGVSSSSMEVAAQMEDTPDL